MNEVDFERVVTVAAYTAANIDPFNKGSREIIGDDWKRPLTRLLVLKQADTIWVDDSG